MRLASRAASAFIFATALVLGSQRLALADPSPVPSASTSFATPTTMAPPSPPGAEKPTCPDVPVFASRDGKSYVVVFSDRSVYSGMVTMTIYTATKTYATHVPLAVALPAHDATFRSVPFAIENPASEPFEATEIDFEGTHVIGGCVVRFRLADRTPSDVDLREAYAGLDPSRPPTQLLRVIVEGNTLTCKNPYASARFDGLEGGRLDYPAMARIMGQTGTVLVKVSLTETGAVDGVAVYHSSRSSYLDQAALNAAQHAHYRPELFRCVPVPGAYLFRADFGAR